MIKQSIIVFALREKCRASCQVPHMLQYLPTHVCVYAREVKRMRAGKEKKHTRKGNECRQFDRKKETTSLLSRKNELR